MYIPFLPILCCLLLPKCPFRDFATGEKTHGPPRKPTGWRGPYPIALNVHESKIMLGTESPKVPRAY